MSRVDALSLVTGGKSDRLDIFLKIEEKCQIRVTGGKRGNLLDLGRKDRPETGGKRGNPVDLAPTPRHVTGGNQGKPVELGCRRLTPSVA